MWVLDVGGAVATAVSQLTPDVIGPLPRLIPRSLLAKSYVVTMLHQGFICIGEVHKKRMEDIP